MLTRCINIVEDHSVCEQEQKPASDIKYIHALYRHENEASPHTDVEALSHSGVGVAPIAESSSNPVRAKPGRIRNSVEFPAAVESFCFTSMPPRSSRCRRLDTASMLRDAGATYSAASKAKSELEMGYSPNSILETVYLLLKFTTRNKPPMCEHAEEERMRRHLRVTTLELEMAHG